MLKALDLTLVIPLYNSMGGLPKLLQSLEKQSIIPDEIIFLDDASPDNSRRVAEAFIQKHPEMDVRIYTNHVNLGIAGTYNRLASLASRKWVQILDADDYLVGDVYSIVEKHMSDDIVAIVVGMRSNVTAISFLNKIFSWLIPKELPKFLPMLGSFATRSGIIYSASLLKEHPFVDPLFDGSDLLHFFDFRQLGSCIYMAKAKIFYTIHPSAFSSKKNDVKYLNALKSRKDIPLSYRFDFFLRKRLFGFLRGS